MKVKIIGMGALGVMYANYIKERAGEDAVCFVMDSSRLERYEGQVFFMQQKGADVFVWRTARRRKRRIL